MTNRIDLRSPSELRMKLKSYINERAIKLIIIIKTTKTFTNLNEKWCKTCSLWHLSSPSQLLPLNFRWSLRTTLQKWMMKELPSSSWLVIIRRIISYLLASWHCRWKLHRTPRTGMPSFPLEIRRWICQAMFFIIPTKPTAGLFQQGSLRRRLVWSSWKKSETKLFISTLSN